MVQGTLDFETTPSYTLVVDATDMAGHSSSTNVTITVTDVAENPMFTAGPYNFSIAENAAFGTLVGTVTATDPQNDLAAYSVSAGDPNGDFSIEWAGQITVQNSLNFETTPYYYTLTIEAQDMMGNTGTTTVTINVTNVSDWVNFDVDSNDDATDDSIEDSDPVLLAVNDDDDDSNGTLDLNDSGPVGTGEDDLEPASISVDQAGSIVPGYTLLITTTAPVNLWMDSAKTTPVPTSFQICIDTIPSTIYIEATGEGSGEIRGRIVAPDSTETGSDFAALQADKYWIERGTVKVSDGTRREVWVGEKVELKAKGPALQNFDWTNISDKYLKNVTVSLATGFVEETHTAADKKKRDIKLHWINKGDKTAEGVFKHPVTGKVLATVKSIWMARAPVTIGENDLQVEQATPIRVDPTNPLTVDTTPTHLRITPAKLELAMEIKHRIVNPDIAGAFIWVHTGNVEVRVDFADGSYSEASVTNHTDAQGQDVWNYGQGLTPSGDTPGISVWQPTMTNAVKASYSMTMELRILFQHTSAGAIPVPVKLITWTWQATAERIENPAQTASIARWVQTPTGEIWDVTLATGTMTVPPPGVQWDHLPTPGQPYFEHWKEVGVDTSNYPTWELGKQMDEQLADQIKVLHNAP